MKTVASTGGICPGGSGIHIEMENDLPVRIRGDRNCPTNDGHLCRKVFQPWNKPITRTALHALSFARVKRVKASGAGFPGMGVKKEYGWAVANINVPTDSEPFAREIGSTKLGGPAVEFIGSEPKSTTFRSLKHPLEG